MDLIGAKALGSARSIERALREAFSFAKAEPRSILVGRTVVNGCLTATARLEHGEARVSTWPETGYAAIDLLGTTIRPELAMTALADAFGAREVILRRQRSSTDMARHARVAPAAKAAPSAAKAAAPKLAPVKARQARAA